MSYHNHTNKSLRIYVLQIIVLYNVILMGWTVEKIGTRKYALSRRIAIYNFDLTEFLHNIVEYKI